MMESILYVFVAKIEGEILVDGKSDIFPARCPAFIPQDGPHIIICSHLILRAKTEKIPRTKRPLVGSIQDPSSPHSLMGTLILAGHTIVDDAKAHRCHRCMMRRVERIDQGHRARSQFRVFFPITEVPRDAAGNFPAPIAGAAGSLANWKPHQCYRAPLILLPTRKIQFPTGRIVSIAPVGGDCDDPAGTDTISIRSNWLAAKTTSASPWTRPSSLLHRNVFYG